jgi:hypothetical protein
MIKEHTCVLSDVSFALLIALRCLLLLFFPLLLLFLLLPPLLHLYVIGAWNAHTIPSHLCNNSRITHVHGAIQWSAPSNTPYGSQSNSPNRIPAVMLTTADGCLCRHAVANIAHNINAATGKTLPCAVRSVQQTAEPFRAVQWRAASRKPGVLETKMAQKDNQAPRQLGQQAGR